MGVGYNDRNDEENPASEDEKEEEIKRLNQPAEDIELKKITPRSYETPHVIEGVVKPTFKTPHLKYALFTFNGILALLGLTILGLAVWIRVDPEFWEYNDSLHIESFYAVCHMLIVVGLIIFFVAFVGCIGALAESQLLLTAYSVVFTLLFILQLSAVIMIWSAPYSKTIRGALEKQIQKQIDKRDGDESSRLFTDLMQQNLECCGSTNQKDYKDRAIPYSCQNSRTGVIHADGCASMMLSYLREKAGVVVGVGVPILLFQICALFVAFCLLYNIWKERNYEMDNVDKF